MKVGHENNNIAVDFDGVIATNVPGEDFDLDVIHEPIEGAAEFLRELSKVGRVVIYSCRTSVELHGPSGAVHALQVMRKYLDEHKLPYDEIYAGYGKPLAKAYVDDRAVSCRPQENPGAYAGALARVKSLA